MVKFIKDWMLVIGIVAGASLYLAYHALPVLHPAGSLLLKLCKSIQPILLFCMLFLSFCKIEPRQMRFSGWMWWLLSIQGLSFVGIAILLMWASHTYTPFALWVQSCRIPIESAMLCLICPTATACAVVTGKLGGDMAGVVTYTVLINLLVALLVPTFVPLIYPQEGMGFWTAFGIIMAKVFPLLLLPGIVAWIVRWLMPSLHAFFLRYAHWSFYLWAAALTLAILMSTRGIVNSHQSISVLVDIAIASAIACAFQFGVGKLIGSRYGSTVSAGQALGQKNTVFGIWMGYTFLDPLVSVAGGFYSVYHNLYNTWQLYRQRKQRPDIN